MLGPSERRMPADPDGRPRPRARQAQAPSSEQHPEAGRTQAYHWSYPPTTASVSVARNDAAAVVADQYPELTDDVRLVVSELATNAVLHAGTAFRLHVGVGDEVVRLEVIDDEPAPPAVRMPALEAASGRGLHLIDALCSGWGVVPTGQGKVVWAELRGGAHHRDRLRGGGPER